MVSFQSVIELSLCPSDCGKHVVKSRYSVHSLFIIIIIIIVLPREQFAHTRARALAIYTTQQNIFLSLCMHSVMWSHRGEGGVK